MSSLMGLLDMGAGAIQAQNAGISTAANNTANVNTEGYSRQRVDLRANLGSPIFGGVTFGDPDRVGDEMVAGRQRLNSGASGYFNSLSGSLLNLEGAMTAGESDISGGLANVFGSLNNVASSPLDPLAREVAVDAARRLALAFGQQANNLDEARAEADLRVKDTVVEASALADEIARLNSAIQQDADPVLIDQRELSALRLAEIVGGRTRLDEDGQMRVLLDNGSVLVDGHRAAQFEAVPDIALDGMTRVDIVDGAHRLDVTRALSSGRLGAELHFRDQVTPSLSQELDQLAFDLTTSLNAVHRSFAGLDGTTGRDFFVEPALVEGAAASMAVDAAVDADPTLLASAAAGQPAGDNAGVLALLDAKDQLLASGNTRTFADESVRFVANIGQEVRAAVIDQKFHEVQRNSLEALRDSISGVSLEEEMNRLSQYQHASQANMRFVQTIDSLLGRMIDLL